MNSSQKPELRLAWSNHRAAKYAVEQWHYSRCLQPSKSLYIGVWEDGSFLGVLVFGTGAGNITNGSMYGLKPMEMAELTRVALRRHKTPVSRIMSIAIRMVKKANPGIRMLVSLADPVRGHLGSIYQASGWVYVGETSKSKTYIDASGREHHERVVSPTGKKKHYGRYKYCFKPSDAVRVRINPGKHKYLYPLDDDIRQVIEPMRKPYPKRGSSIDSDAPRTSGEKAAQVRPIRSNPSRSCLAEAE